MWYHNLFVMKHFDVIITGAGLAGLATAAHLVEQNPGLRLLICDSSNIASGASGVPGAMVNPLTGRRANKVWQAEHAMELLEARLERLTALSDLPLSLNNGILRPAIDEQLAHNFRKALERNTWTPDWVEWVSAETVRKRIPYLKENSGALWIKKGKVLQSAEYLQAYTKYLKKAGVEFRFGGPYKMEQRKNWVLDYRHERIAANKVIVTAGYRSRENRYWVQLPMNSVKGQLAVYRCKERVDHLPAISAYGYIAPVTTHQLVVGSTYEHHFDDQHPDHRGAGQLDQRFEELLRPLYEKSERIGQWSGIRATTADRLPLAGMHPEFENLYVVAGLGSKGVILSEKTAMHMAAHVLEGTALPEEISLYRLAEMRKLRSEAAEKDRSEEDQSSS